MLFKKLWLFWLCASIFLVTGLFGCASFYDIEVDSASAYQKPIVIDANYAISGRFSINSAQKHDYGNFVWTKTINREELDFNTPLGQTVAQIVIESGVPILTTKDRVYVGNDLDKMLYDHLGFVLPPIKYLHYWIQGVPFPSTDVLKQLPDGFTQMGWNVEYLKWQDRNHPHILKCSNKDLVVKLLINW